MADKNSRPSGHADIAESTEIAILDAAEHLFADHGFDATSVRAIGTKAGVNPALLHYYFSTKEDLLRRVVERRSSSINSIRRERLLMLFANSSPTLPTLEDVLEVIIRPTIELGRDENQGGSSYTRIIHTLSAAKDPRFYRLIADNFDPIARYSIECIQRVVPDLTKADAVDCYMSMIQISFMLMAPTGRAVALADGHKYEQDAERAIRFATLFAAAGIRALAVRRAAPA
ncbi:MAG: TetR family transcriptional regulator [Mesorhizobium sp.]|nr:TetR/AcrR family transcriptional regulator [Mesorhizobium sp.]MCO5162244.1 TetR family transcriptional regulator [Mesorhizobium sp.]